jgi:hypothetical protein
MSLQLLQAMVATLVHNKKAGIQDSFWEYLEECMQYFLYTMSFG